MVFDYSGAKWVFKEGEGWSCDEETTIVTPTDSWGDWDYFMPPSPFQEIKIDANGKIVTPKKHEVKNLSKSQRDQFDALLSC